MRHVLGTVLFGAGCVLLALPASRNYYPRLPDGLFVAIQFFFWCVCILWFLVAVPRFVRYPIFLGSRIELNGNEIRVYTQRGRCIMHCRFTEVLRSGDRADLCFNVTRFRHFVLPLSMLGSADRELLLDTLHVFRDKSKLPSPSATPGADKTIMEPKPDDTGSEDNGIP